MEKSNFIGFGICCLVCRLLSVMDMQYEYCRYYYIYRYIEIKQISFSRHLCLAGKDELSQHYRERMLYFSYAHVLSATNRFDPECEPHLDVVLNQESIHCS